MPLIKVLAVEDDEFYSKALFRVMEVEYTDIEVKIARDYDEAVEHYTASDFDLLLVDLDLRGSKKQGWEFIMEIREQDQDIVIYVLTGIEYEGIISEHEFKKKYKVKEWLRKPIPAWELCRYFYKEFGLADEDTKA